MKLTNYPWYWILSRGAKATVLRRPDVDGVVDELGFLPLIILELCYEGGLARKNITLQVMPC